MADILQTNDTWRQDDIYLFVLLVAQERTAMLFHGVDLSQMDQRVWELEDVNGVKFIQEMIRVGGEGGGFVEYYFDNPAIEGDEETGSYTLICRAVQCARFFRRTTFSLRRKLLSPLPRHGFGRRS